MTPAEVVRRGFAAWAVVVVVPLIRLLGAWDDRTGRGEDDG